MQRATYTRENPSPRYRELLELYRDMHENGERFHGIPAGKTFAGQSLPRQAGRIKGIAEMYPVDSILDYGSGKGKQYGPHPIKLADGREYADIPAFWGAHVTCFDPGYRPHSIRPTTRFGGVVCTDVVEHCPEEDLGWIVDELFSFAERFVYINAACYPAQKRLPNGENAHCTIKPPQWWQSLLEDTNQRYPHVHYFAAVEFLDGGKMCETLFRGTPPNIRKTALKAG